MIARCVAVGLGEAGWTVHVTARTVRDGESDRPGSITKTAEQVTRAGGRGILMRSDHSVDSETEAAHYIASACAARMMVPRRSGLIVNISSVGAIKYTGNVSYSVVKAAVDMLTLSTAEELRSHNVAVVSIWPRLTRTEALIAHPGQFSDPSKAWSAEFNGQYVAALANDPRIIEKSGDALWTSRKWLSNMDWRTPTAESRCYARKPDPRAPVCDLPPRPPESRHELLHGPA